MQDSFLTLPGGQKLQVIWMKNNNKMNQNQTPLLDGIVEYTKEAPAYFKIPGHRYERGISPRWRQYTGDGIFRFDLTEAEGLDDLHCPQGIIAKAQELAAEVFSARASYFLVNGTTCGNEAMVLSCAKEGEKIMVPRNAHKSVLMGLIMSGAVPVYLMPEYEEKSGLGGSITLQAVERGFLEHPDCKGVFLVSPTYYGVCSDIAAIAGICHRHQALLLVDEAHGGHLYFHEKTEGTWDLPRGAILQGADLCVQSMHKVTGSLTQSSLLHVGSDRADRGLLEENLRMVQSTSPSYLLMTSLDAARYELALHGPEMLGRALKLAEDARGKIGQIPGLACYGKEVLGEKIHDLDLTRLVISASDLGISGYELADCLYEQYHVGVELADEKNVVAIVTYANEERELEQLTEALADISRRIRKGEKKTSGPAISLPLCTLPDMIYTPRQAYFAKKSTVDWNDAVGKISGESFVPYPPGIPLLYPGERISREIWQYMDAYRKKGYHFHGPADRTLSKIRIISE